MRLCFRKNRNAGRINILSLTMEISNIKCLRPKRIRLWRKMLHKRKPSGFTIIEALVSLVILTTGILPALYLSGLANNLAGNIKNNMVATGLAEEGVEVIRALRDKNWLASAPFDQGLVGTWFVEWNSDIPMNAAGGSPYIKLNNGNYNYTLGKDTIFKRTVTVTQVNSGEIKVIADVIWNERGRLKNIQIESHFYDWR